MSTRSVVVLAGGLSFEREVSLRSGSRMAEALADAGWDVQRRDLDERLVPTLAAAVPDAVVLALHGKAGEDGTVQSILELLDVPYTGPDPSASALVWDKGICKGAVGRGGVPTPAWVTISSDAIRDLGVSRILDRVGSRVGTSVVVKPTRGGGSMGVSLVTDPSGLNAALTGALSYDSSVLIEQYVEGTEVAVAIMDGEPLPPVEVAAGSGRYDFSARYTPGAVEFFAPARLPSATLRECQAMALRAWEMTGCRDLARADFIVDQDGVPWLLEIDTCPGMTETSLLPRAVEAAGSTFEDFCVRLVGLALRRRAADGATSGGSRPLGG